MHFAENQHFGVFSFLDHDNSAEGTSVSLGTSSVSVWQHIDLATAMTPACRSINWYHSDPAALGTLGKMET